MSGTRPEKCENHFNMQVYAGKLGHSVLTSLISAFNRSLKQVEILECCIKLKKFFMVDIVLITNL